jgi:hypothetical protein
LKDSDLQYVMLSGVEVCPESQGFVNKPQQWRPATAIRSGVEFGQSTVYQLVHGLVEIDLAAWFAVAFAVERAFDFVSEALQFTGEVAGVYEGTTVRLGSGFGPGVARSHVRSIGKTDGQFRKSGGDFPLLRGNWLTSCVNQVATKGFAEKPVASEAGGPYIVGDDTGDQTSTYRSSPNHFFSGAELHDFC